MSYLVYFPISYENLYDVLIPVSEVTSVAIPVVAPVVTPVTVPVVYTDCDCDYFTAAADFFYFYSPLY